MLLLNLRLSLVAWPRQQGSNRAVTLSMRQPFGADRGCGWHARACPAAGSKAQCLQRKQTTLKQRGQARTGEKGGRNVAQRSLPHHHAYVQQQQAPEHDLEASTTFSTAQSAHLECLQPGGLCSPGHRVWGVPALQRAHKHGQQGCGTGQNHHAGHDDARDAPLAQARPIQAPTSQTCMHSSWCRQRPSACRASQVAPHGACACRVWSLSPSPGQYADTAMIPACSKAGHAGVKASWQLHLALQWVMEEM